MVFAKQLPAPFLHRLDNHIMRIEYLFGVLGLRRSVSVAEIFQITASIAEHFAADVVQPFQTGIVCGCGLFDIHGSDSMSSSGVIICGVCRPRADNESVPAVRATFSVAQVWFIVSFFVIRNPSMRLRDRI